MELEMNMFSGRRKKKCQLQALRRFKSEHHRLSDFVSIFAVSTKKYL